MLISLVFLSRTSFRNNTKTSETVFEKYNVFYQLYVIVMVTFNIHICNDLLKPNCVKERSQIFEIR